MNYKEAGVDVEKGDFFIEKIKPFVRSTYSDDVKSGVGGFASLYDQGDRYLAAGTDGVGTKLKLAKELDIHNTIGIDLVAMCVNDIICTGAKPLFFLDYLATGHLDIETHLEVVKGISKGCLEANCALIGGETAEMPGMYTNSEYDLAGFSVGDVLKSNLIDGKSIQEGMTILGLKSSGFHSNGFSLVRKLIADEPKELKEQCLTPTRIYTQIISNLSQTKSVKGLAHITGGGLNNIARINPEFGYNITYMPEMPKFMDQIVQKSNLSIHERYTTFNMGVGFAIVTDRPDILLDVCSELIEIGHVTHNFNGVKVFDQLI